MKKDGVLKAAASLPWAILPEKLEAIFDVLEFHAEGLRLTKEEVQARVGLDAKSGAPSTAHGSVAVLPLYGVLSQRMNMMSEMSGGTSTERFAAEFDALVKNPNVSAIVLDIDSPGGSMFGIPEAAAKIRAARDVKPIYAIANGTMASAAYYLGSQATEVIASPSSLVGSIGVYMVHLDDTAAMQNEGVSRTVISAGAHKAEGIGPLTTDARAHLQAIVDEAYRMMVADIGAGRGIAAQDVEANYGQGRVFGASTALSQGIVDRVATLDDVVAELVSAQRPPGRVRGAADPPRVAFHAIRPAAAQPGGLRISAVMPDGSVLPLAVQPATGPSAASAAFTSTIAARKAEETAMDTQIAADPARTAKNDNNPDAVAALEKANARMARSQTIFELCALAGASLAEANGFVASDKTAEQVRQELAARVQAPKPIAQVGAMKDREADRPFRTLGEQLVAIAAVNPERPEATTDKRLLSIMAAASGGSANVPSDGGFLIQQDFTVDLMKEAVIESQLASDCSSTEVSATSDGLRVAYIDETSRATGSRWGGIQIYRGAEADSATAKKPKIGEWEARVYDLIGLAYMTERLLSDAPAMQSVFQAGFNAEFAFVLDDEIIRGTGAGQCLGLKNSAALVTQAKETGQLAGTVVAENILNMWARLLPRARVGATWYINQEVEKLLQTMQIGTGVSGQLVYMAPGGLSGKNYGTIYGCQVKIVEQCDAPGTVSDVILANLRQAYQIVTKGGLQSDSSIHVRFINNERTFRWVSRIGGAPRLKSAITPYKGANTLSDHVMLAAR